MNISNLERNIYKTNGCESYNLEDKVWKFLPGTYV